jgi:thioesterase domain-containing protein
MDLKSAKQMSEGGIQFVAHTGLRVVEMRGGYVKCVMPFEGNGNHIGTMYAGALFTLADIAAGALFLASFDAAQYFAVVKQLDLRFLKPANGDVTVECTMSEDEISALSTEVAQRSKADFILESELIGGSGTVVAESRGVFQMRKRATSGAWVPNV